MDTISITEAENAAFTILRDLVDKSKKEKLTVHEVILLAELNRVYMDLIIEREFKAGNGVGIELVDVRRGRSMKYICPLCAKPHETEPEAMVCCYEEVKKQTMYQCPVCYEWWKTPFRAVKCCGIEVLDE